MMKLHFSIFHIVAVDPESLCILLFSYSSLNRVTMIVAGRAIMIRPQNTAQDPIHFPRVDIGTISPYPETREVVLETRI